MKFLAVLAFLGAAFAATENEVLVKFQPITTEQYESLMKINAGKPVIPEVRLINSAVSGLAGLATGFQMGKLLPNLFGGSDNQISKGSLGGYPLCTLNGNEPTARQADGISYINMEKLTEALARPGSSAKGLPVINCVLVLDDGKGQHPEHPTHRPTKRPPRPTTTVRPHNPHPYPPFYPWYHTHPYPLPYPPPPPYHPYRPPPHHVNPPPHHNSYPPRPPCYPYKKYEPNEIDEEYEHDDDEYETVETPIESPMQMPTIGIHSFLLDNRQALHEPTSTPTTTRRSTRRPTGRPTRRPTRHSTSKPTRKPHSEFPKAEYKSQRQVYNDDLDEYDDSIDYIEVSKKAQQ